MSMITRHLVACVREGTMEKKTVRLLLIGIFLYVLAYILMYGILIASGVYIIYEVATHIGPLLVQLHDHVQSLKQ